VTLWLCSILLSLRKVRWCPLQKTPSGVPSCVIRRELHVPQSESVALQPGLARDCAAEREQHCAGVQPGQSRVFNCLIANARQVGAS